MLCLLAAGPARAADFTPLSADFQVNVWNLVSLLIALGTLWAFGRRKPPLDAQLVRLETSIEALNRNMADLATAQKQAAGHELEIAALKDKVRNLEARRDEDLRAQRTYTRETTRELFEKMESNARITQDRLDALANDFAARIETLSQSLSENIQSVERGLGRLEGQMESMRDRMNQPR
ncbi:MAG: hypothetical protein HZA93_24170 [Verrucomicrobia bacterium]|nr:hypothetical protein [Verrucomicrobiota bacterium]